MKRRLLSCLLVLALLPALLLPWAGAAGLTTDFKTLRINSVAEPPHNLGDSGSDVTVVVVGRVTCGLTLNRVGIAQDLMERLNIPDGRVYLLDMDQEREMVEQYAASNSGVHVAWNGGERTYQSLFWEIHRAYFPESSGSATLPALCVLDGDFEPIYYVSGSAFERETLAEVLAPYGNGGEDAPSYIITPETPEHGTLTVSAPDAKAGETVTITVTPDSGYQVGMVLVTYLDNTYPIEKQSEQVYTFTMPKGAVQVYALFNPAPGLPEPDPEPEKPTLSFQDVNQGDYFYDAVQWAVGQEITTGTGNNQFSPNGVCNRGQMVTFLWRAAHCPAPSGSAGFSDVNENAYYHDAVAWAVEQGITTGTSPQTFSPDEPVTRGQAVTFLYRYAGTPAASGGSFEDVADGAYYADAVRWAVSEGLTNGVTPTRFVPNDNCTRAHVVTFLYRGFGDE